MRRLLSRAAALPQFAVNAGEFGDDHEHDRDTHQQVEALAVQQFPTLRLTLQNVPPTVGDQFERLIEELSQLIQVPLRVIRHQIGEDRTSYVVEIMNRDAPSHATARTRNTQDEH